MFDDDYAGLNFWPAFADFMLALLLVFLTAFGITHLTPSGVTVVTARDCQKILESRFRDNCQPKSAAGQQVLFRTDPQNPFLLRIRFQDQLLFDEDHAELKPEGNRVLGCLALIIQEQLDSIREIQIHGHADTKASRRFKSNLHLAAERANSVFEFLRGSGINPADRAISTTSYGEYFPANRTIDDPAWSSARIRDENQTPGQRQLNRRVELLLFYGEHARRCGDPTVKTHR